MSFLSSLGCFSQGIWTLLSILADLNFLFGWPQFVLRFPNISALLLRIWGPIQKGWLQRVSTLPTFFSFLCSPSWPKEFSLFSLSLILTLLSNGKARYATVSFLFLCVFLLSLYYVNPCVFFTPELPDGLSLETKR